MKTQANCNNFASGAVDHGASRQWCALLVCTVMASYSGVSAAEQNISVSLLATNTSNAGNQTVVSASTPAAPLKIQTLNSAQTHVLENGKKVSVAKQNISISLLATNTSDTGNQTVVSAPKPATALEIQALDLAQTHVLANGKKQWLLPGLSAPIELKLTGNRSALALLRLIDANVTNPELQAQRNGRPLAQAEPARLPDGYG